MRRVAAAALVAAILVVGALGFAGAQRSSSLPTTDALQALVAGHGDQAVLPLADRPERPVAPLAVALLLCLCAGAVGLVVVARRAAGRVVGPVEAVVGPVCRRGPPLTRALPAPS